MTAELCQADVNLNSDLEMSTGVDIAHETFAHHAKSFRLAANFLPKENIDDIAVVYHFCRMVDDAVDEAPSIDVAHQNLNEILEKLHSHSPSSLDLFKGVMARHDIPMHAVAALMQGCEGDLHPVRVETTEELARYCYQVAGSVGEMMSPLLNVESSEAAQYAIDLGLGMQITNICRDVLEDAERGRVYVPEVWLSEAGLSATDILNSNTDVSKMAAVIDRMLATAEICYRRAFIGCRFIPFRNRLGILVARRVYRAIGLKLQSHHQSNPFHGRTMLTKWEKVFQVGLGFLDALNPVTLGWWRPQVPASPFYTSVSELFSDPSLEE